MTAIHPDHANLAERDLEAGHARTSRPGPDTVRPIDPARRDEASSPR